MLANQVGFAAQDDNSRAGRRRFSRDSWDGYVADRQRVLDFLKELDQKNTVVITGDKHQNSVRNVAEHYTDPAGPILTTEFIGTSISSDGDDPRSPSPATAAIPTTLTSCSTTSTAATCAWSSTASKRPGAATSASWTRSFSRGVPARTLESWIVHHGVPGASLLSGEPSAAV